MKIRKQVGKGLTLICCLALLLGMLGPIEARAEMGKPGQAVTYSSSGGHIGAIDDSGALWMWGSNGYGQIGNGGAGDDSRYDGPYQTVPVKVMEDVASVSCGGFVTAAIKTDGSLWMWGNNGYYQLGNGGVGNAKKEGQNSREQLKVYQTVPVKVMDDVAAVSCGGSHTAAIKTDGSLWMWGDNTPGALGNDRQYDYIVNDFAPNDRHVYQSVPIKVMDGAAAVSCAGSLNSGLTAVIKTDGSLWMFGGNSYGAVGNGGGGDVFVHNLYWAQTVPVKVLDGVAQVTTDGAVTSALKSDGTVWSWGGNPNLVGSGKSGTTPSPVQIAEDVAVLGQNAFIKKDGSFWMWGHTIPDLGVKPTYPNSCSEYVPLKLLDGGVAFSGYNALIKSDGTILQWGNVPMGDGTKPGSTSRVEFKKVTQVPNMKAKVPGGQKPVEPTNTTTDSGSASLPKLSKQEMASLLASASTQTPGSVFVTAPSCAAPYSAGQVRQEVLDGAAKRLSVLRRIAGLPAVTADPALCEQAQYGAVLLAASEFSHYPKQPGDMDDAFYAKGKAATSSSNIYAGLAFMGTPDGFMDDSDAGNVDRLGHRRWQLNPRLGKVGFGYAEVSTGYRRYTAEKVFDTSANTADYQFISWPASGNFPSDLTAFEKNTAWSVSVNPSRYKKPVAADLTVTLTRASDGKVWSFSGENQYAPSGAGLYFNVDSDGYGIDNCIIFRPDGIGSYAGVYTVRIDGLRTANGQPASLSYQVDFFKSADYKPEDPSKPVSFTDVKQGDWFKPYVEKASSAGLINGYGNGRFGPNDELEISQALKLAAEIDMKATGGTLPATGGKWYMPYYQYCLDRGIITSRQVSPSDLERAATRYEMVAILDKAVPASRMTPVKTVNSIPDVAEDSQYGPVVYKWYRAGIVEGSGGGYFHGSSTIKRSEVAAILCRINNL